MATSSSPFAEGLSNRQQGRPVALLQRLLADVGYPVAEHEQQEQRYGGSTMLAVQQWRAGELDPAIPAERLDGSELSKEDLAKLWQEARSCKRVVQGTVTLADGTPVPGLRITAFDRDFRSEQLLGKARTDAEGRYRITYTALAALRAEKASADLGLRIHSADGKTLLHSSGSNELLMNAPAEAQLDRLVDLPPGALPNAFDQLVDALKPLIGEVPIAAIQADPAADEGPFLVRELEVEAGTLTHLVIAHRLQEQAEVPAPYSFALLEEDGLFGVGPSRPRVLLTPVTWATDTRTALYALVLLESEAAKAALERAVRRHRVSPGVLRQFGAIQKQLERWREEAEAFQRSGLIEQVLSGLDDRLAAGQAGDLLQLFGPLDPSKLDALRDRLFPPNPAGDRKADKAKAATRVELSALLGHHLGLVEEVAESLGADTPEDLRRLAQLERKDWSALISKGNVRLGGAPIPKALARRQASLIVRRFERRFPTAAFSAQLARREPPELPQAAAVAELLDAHPDLDLTSHRLRPFLRAADVDPQTMDADVLDAAETLQRLFQLTGSYSKSEGLLKAGFRSSADIVAAGRGNFIEAAGSHAAMEPSEAEAVFATASQRNVASLMLATELRSLSQPMVVEAAATGTVLSGQLEAIVADQPDLRVLFGSNDACACQHCRSIYGPAAYLADALRFLRQRRASNTLVNPAVAINPKTVLFERRPDLGEIDLNCANAETPVPHIDIVCELLEEAIAPDAGFPFMGAIAAGKPSAALLEAIRAKFEVADTAVIYGNTPTPPAPSGPPTPPFLLRDPGLSLLITNTGPNAWTLRRLRQTHGSAAERAAAPEYVNDDAYDALAAPGVKTAFDLPFDLPHLEVRAFLGAMEIQRQELMAALATSAAPATEVIAAEAVGLAPAERAVVTTAAGTAPNNDQPEVWGVSGSSATPSLDHLDRFSTHTGLSYSQVVDLIALPWVRGQVVNLVARPSHPWLEGGVNLFIRHLDTSCDLAQKLIVNLSDTVLDRVHRLLRLSRRTGLASFDLARLAIAPKLGNGSLGDPALVALATLRELSRDLSVPAEELITWLDVIPLGGTSITHGRLFQNPAATGPLDRGLAPAAIESNEVTEAASPGNGRKLVALRTDLCQVWGLSDGDFTRLHSHLATGYGGLLPGGAAPILSRVALAAIHGRVGLAKALGFSVAELLSLELLLGLDPLASANNLKQLVDAARQLQASGVSSVELGSRLEAPAAAQWPQWALAESAITARLQALQTALIQAKKQHASPYQNNLAALEQLESLERALQSLPAVSDQAITAVRELLRAEAPSTAQVTAAKVVVDGPLAGLAHATAIKGSMDSLGTAATEAAREAERLAILELILKDLAAAALLQEARQATANTLVDLMAFSSDQAEVLLDRLTLNVGSSLVSLAELFIPNTWLSGATTPSPTPWIAGSVSPATTPNLYRAIRLAQAVVGLLPVATLSPEALAFLLSRGDALHSQGWLRLRDLPFEAGLPALPIARWQVLRDGLDLITRFPAVPDPARPGATLAALDLLQQALASTTIKYQLLASLALVTGWPLARLQDLDTHFGFLLADYAKPATWNTLEKAVVLLHRLGSSLPEALLLAGSALIPATSQLARRLLRARYSEADWLPALKALMDPIRERKRDALITHLLATNPGLKSRLDVYDVFLTDPEWSARMPSSRLVQAHSTVQLFIRRCMEGLEPKAVADLSDTGWKQWEWMKNYRVWEVARKVFVDAQYYLKPQWRDDKTEIFTEFESTLQQKELNEENVNAAFEGYLDRLDQIAFLDVMATCYDLQNYSLHVVAASKGGEPRLYYHRRLDRERFWTPWTKIDLDISGDHLIAFFRNQRLHLAWATFIEKGNEEQRLPFPQQSSSDQPLPRAEKRLEIRLAVSEFTGKRWLPRRVSRDAITTDWSQDPIDRATLQLTVNPDPEWFTVDLYRNPGSKQALQPLGSFLLTGCKGYPEVRRLARAPVLLSPQFENTTFYGQRLKEIDPKEIDPSSPAVEEEQDLAIQGVFGGFGSAILFNRTPGIFRVSYPFQSTEIDHWINWMMDIFYSRLSDYRLKAYGTGMPFFFEDNLRGYVLVPGLYGELGRDGNRTTIKTFSNLHELTLAITTLARIYLTRLNSAASTQERAAVWSDLFRDPKLAEIFAEINVYLSLTFGYEVRNFYHPRLCFLRQRFIQGGINQLLSRDTQLAKGSFDFGNTAAGYSPSPLIVAPYPVEELEFGITSAYAAYNWELTFHAPHLMATMLMAAQRYDEAETWLRYIFDPRGLAGDPTLQGDPTRSRYWMTKPFYQRSATDYTNQRLDRIFNRLANDPTGATETELVAAVDQWRRDPFKPYLVARSRTVAFQQAIVHLTARLYLERGDQCFRRDSLEDLVMASLDYSRAERLLGPRPQMVPTALEVPPETYNQLEARLDAFGNALCRLENLLPDLSVLPQGGAELPSTSPSSAPPINFASLYFCIPPSEKLFEIWDTLAERQFNLRNSRTIDGAERDLSLFAPPLSVEALIQASAAGLSIGEILSALSAPMPPYRFRVMLRHAIDLANVVAGFSQKLEQAVAAADGEGLQRLRSDHEGTLLREQQEAMRQEIQAAINALDSARKGKQMHEESQQFYAGRPYMNAWEIAATVSYGASLALQTVTAIGYAAAGGLALIPKFMVGAAGFGGSPTANVQSGGDQISQGARDVLVGVLSATGAALDKAGSMLSQQGSFLVRHEDWQNTARNYQREIERAEIEIQTTQIRQRIAEEQLRVQQIRREQQAAEATYLRSKFTNKELYDWMVGQLQGLSRELHKLATEAAKAAERCYQYELGSIDAFIQPGHWQDSRKGLLAAECLQADLRRMENAYHQRHRRELELTTHVSLARLDPIALLELRSSGKCVVQIPEAYFDLEQPGHYFRRIKSLSVSVPCVVGPQGSVALKLTQTSNRVRVTTAMQSGLPAGSDPYAEDPSNDARFRYNVGSVQSITLSRGQDDAGLFSVNLEDDRYLPFEGCGAIGTYALELPDPLRTFDYSTITDVVFHVRYTARDGGGGFRASVQSNLRSGLNQMILKTGRTGLFHAFDLRRDHPELWHRLISTGNNSFTLDRNWLPYFISSQGVNLSILSLQLMAKFTSGGGTPTLAWNNGNISLNPATDPGLAGFSSGAAPAGVTFGSTITLSTNSAGQQRMRELLLIVNYKA